MVAPFESLVLMGALNFDHQQDSWKQVSGGTGRHTLQVLAHISTDSNAAGKLWWKPLYRTQTFLLMQWKKIIFKSAS